MSEEGWLKYAAKNETPTHAKACPECGGRGRWKVGSVDETPIYKRCWRCKGSGEVGAVLVKVSRMDLEKDNG